MKEKLFNIYLKLRWKFWRNRAPKKDFSKYPILFTRSSFSISDIGIKIKSDERYNQNSIWFSRFMVYSNHLGKLCLKCVYNPSVKKGWQGEIFTKWVSGCIETDPICNYGVWEIRARVPQGWPAIWLLREKHSNNDNIETITPEVDIMEVIREEFQHTIHFKPTGDRYSTDGANNRLKYDDDLHTFAVDLRRDGYDFYIDGIMTARLRNGEDSVTNARSYLVINHAVHADQKDNSIVKDLIIDSIIVRENEFTDSFDHSKSWVK